MVTTLEHDLCWFWQSQLGYNKAVTAQAHCGPGAQPTNLHLRSDTKAYFSPNYWFVNIRVYSLTKSWGILPHNLFPPCCSASLLKTNLSSIFLSVVHSEQPQFLERTKLPPGRAFLWLHCLLGPHRCRSRAAGTGKQMLCPQAPPIPHPPAQTLCAAQHASQHPSSLHLTATPKGRECSARTAHPQRPGPEEPRSLCS